MQFFLMCHNLWIIKIGNLQAEILVRDVPVKANCGKIAGIQAYDCNCGVTVTSLVRLITWNLVKTSSRPCLGPLHAWNCQNRTARRNFMAINVKSLPKAYRRRKGLKRRVSWGITYSISQKFTDCIAIRIFGPRSLQRTKSGDNKWNNPPAPLIVTNSGNSQRRTFPLQVS